jgi:outer membrane immunogenic protein
MKLLLAGAAIGLTAASSANAADMYRKAPPATPLTQAEVAYIQPEAVHNWSGFYAGGVVDYTWGSDVVGILSPVNVGRADVRGFGGGLTVGYNYQSGRFVAGLEADIVVSSAKDDLANALAFGGSVATLKYPWMLTVRPRVGYAFDNVLLYVTGGLAVGGVDNYVAATLPAASLHTKTTRAGFAVGAGAEYAFTKQISVKAEYLYTDLATHTDRFGPAYFTKSIATANHFRVGLNYHF